MPAGNLHAYLQRRQLRGDGQLGQRAARRATPRRVDVPNCSRCSTSPPATDRRSSTSNARDGTELVYNTPAPDAGVAAVHRRRATRPRGRRALAARRASAAAVRRGLGGGPRKIHRADPWSVGPRRGWRPTTARSGWSPISRPAVPGHGRDLTVGDAERRRQRVGAGSRSRAGVFSALTFSASISRMLCRMVRPTSRAERHHVEAVQQAESAQEPLGQHGVGLRRTEELVEQAAHRLVPPARVAGRVVQG